MAVTLPASIYKFGNFELDCGRFELRLNGRTVRLERKPMELLILLASREGLLVTREEIAQRLWSSEVFVDTEHGINTAIRKLRHLLRDDPDDPHFILTITGQGYRFIAPVSTVAPDIPTASAVSPAAPHSVTAATAQAAVVPSRRRALGWYTGAAICLAFAIGGIALYRTRHHPRSVRYTQLTDFTDSAVAPALSPDGRMVAFIRGNSGFLTTDQIYVKMLPNGEAKRVTDDNRPKYGLAFSPDGTDVAYTVLDRSGFSTYEVSVLGGESHLLLNNAAGLVWLNPKQVLFSEVLSGIHLGVVTATTDRAGLREIYFPAHERGMAHDSSPSPDQRWALVVEMNGNGDWAPCRLIALAGQSAPKDIGPASACTSAAWSPDGRWMYFTAAVDGRSHVWRQRFPDGSPEQVTFGPTEEIGLAMESDGRALITSVGVHESAIWIHDGNAERPLSSEGEVVGVRSPPSFNPDSSMLYYLLHRGDGSGTELWRTWVNSGNSEAVFPGVSMTAFDLSPDGKQVVYTTAESNGTTQLWLAAVDRSSPATRVNISAAHSPYFGARGQILFQRAEGNTNYLEQVNADGSHRAKVLPYPIEDLETVSPSRRWVIAAVPKPDKSLAPIMAIPLDGGAAHRICTDYCRPRWSTDGKFLIVPIGLPSRTSPGRSLAIPLGPGESLPDLPPGGIAPQAAPSLVKGAELVGRAELVPGKDPQQYAWINTTVHRNLYLISLP